jgi:hypothetical protein
MRAIYRAESKITSPFEWKTLLRRVLLIRLGSCATTVAASPRGWQTINDRSVIIDNSCRWLIVRVSFLATMVPMEETVIYIAKYSISVFSERETELVSNGLSKTLNLGPKNRIPDLGFSFLVAGLWCCFRRNWFTRRPEHKTRNHKPGTERINSLLREGIRTIIDIQLERL